MKKLLQILLTLLVMLAGASCAKKTDSDFVWTREGYFTDEDGNLVIIYKSDMEGFEGWSVSYSAGEESHGWIIRQEGNTLHGDLDEGDESEYVVTVSEDGEDGILLVTPDKKEHRFGKMELPTVIGTLFIKTEGMGQISYSVDGTDPVFSDDYPFTYTSVNLIEASTFRIAAKADEGWKFVRWRLNGEDYSTDDIITVEVDGNADFVAVFEPAED